MLTLLLAGMSALGPFAIDAYLPAFAGIAKSVNASPAQMQQTLSAYLFAFAFMNLFHGALSDALGRKPVILAGIAMFGVASVGCAMAQSIETLILFRALQGLANGAGMVVSRAVIRDLFAPAQAQKVMSQVTIVFGLAPAIAPMVGGLLYEHADWHSIFWMLAGLSLALAASLMLWLPETLPVAARQPLAVMPMMRGYRQLLLSPRFLLLCVTSSVPFNGMFLYVLCAPSFLGDILGLPPSQYFWFFIVTISGIMGGAFASGRLAARPMAWSPRSCRRWSCIPRWLWPARRWRCCWPACCPGCCCAGTTRTHPECRGSRPLLVWIRVGISDEPGRHSRPNRIHRLQIRTALAIRSFSDAGSRNNTMIRWYFQT